MNTRIRDNSCIRRINEKYILVERVPDVEEYQKLRAKVGWGSKNSEASRIALNNSLFSVCVMLENNIIGFGRVIGDGGVYLYIQDVIVLPEFQGQGIGKCIMDAVMDYLNTHTFPGTFVGLMAAKEASGFYEQFGFVKRPPEGPGMFKIM